PALSTSVSGVSVDSGDVARSVLDHLGEDTNVSLTIPTGVSADPSVQAGGEVGARGAAGKGGNASRGLPDPASLPGAHAEAGPLRWLRARVDSDVPELQRLLAQALHAVVCVPDARTGMALTAARPDLTAVTVHGEVLSTTRVSRARTASGTRLASQTALEDTQTLIAELEGRSETIASALDELEPRVAAASAEAATALEALHSSDAKIMAAAEEVSRITGEIDSSRTRLQRAEDNATELQSRLQAAEREAESAQAA